MILRHLLVPLFFIIFLVPTSSLLVEKRKIESSEAKPQSYTFPSSLTYSLSLTSSITLSWSIVDDTLALSVTRTGGKGWFGLSFGATDGAMTDGDMLIATVTDDTVAVNDYWSSGMTWPQTDASLGGSNDVLFSSGVVSDSDMTIQVIRPLAARDASFDRPIVPGDMQVAFAYGDQDELNQHTTQNRHSISVNFFSGGMGYRDILRYIHGSIMFLSWGVLLLFGVMWAHYFRENDGKICGIPKWFFVHRITQYTGFVLSIIGFIIALIMVQIHYATLFHAQLGTALIGLSLIQVAFAFFRPNPAGEDGEKTMARKIFEYQHIWTGRMSVIIAIPVIISGLLELDTSIGLLLYSIYICFIFLLFIAYLLYRLYLHFTPKPTDKEEMENLKTEPTETEQPQEQELPDLPDPTRPPTALQKRVATPYATAPTVLAPPPISPYSRSPFARPLKHNVPMFALLKDQAPQPPNTTEEMETEKITDTE